MSMHFTARIPARDFGFDSDKTVLGFLPHTPERVAHARTIAVDSDHMFDPALFERIRLWWEWHDTRSPLYISGPSGCGKTSTVLQFLARVHAPVVTLTCRRRMDKSDLIGQWGVTDRKGTFGWFDGPATVAWKHGCVLVINEFSLAPPEVWVAVNDLFEGDALVNERRNEVIPMHPNTRVVITDNCRCSSFGTDFVYRDRHLQDISSAERFWHVHADWPLEAAESALIAKKARAAAVGGYDAAACVAAAMRFARKSRRPEEARTSGLDNIKQLKPVSTRVLIRIVQLLVRFVSESSPVTDPVGEAVALAIGNALSDAECHALQVLAHFEFAEMFQGGKK